MAQTVIRGTQILNNTVQRQDLDTSTVGQAVVTKLVQGSGITLSSTGADSGTGDVTVTSPDVVSTDAGNIATLGSDNHILVPQSQIWSVRLRSFNAIVGNPTFEVDQRTAGAGIVNPATAAFPIDRYQVFKSVSTATATIGQVIPASPVLVPGTNFAISRCCLNIALTAQQATLAAGDYYVISHTMEGINLRELIGDVHSMSLLVNANLAPLKFGIRIQDAANTRSLTKLCTIPTPNTWTLIQLSNLPVFPSAGTFNLTPGSVGCTIAICLACGTTFTAPANDTWQTGNFIGAVGQDNFFSKPVNTGLQIAFIQHEPGALCTTPIDCPFPQAYDDALRCFCKSYDYAVKPGTATTAGRVPFVVPLGLLTLAEAACFFPKPMAKAPTIGIYNPADGSANSCTDNTNSGSKATSSPFASERIFSQFTLGTASTAGALITAHYTADTGW